MVFTAFIVAMVGYGITEVLAQPSRPSFTLEMAWATTVKDVHVLHIGVCCTDYRGSCWEYAVIRGNQVRRPKLRFTVRSVAHPVAIRAAVDDVLDRAARTCMASS